MYINTYIFHSCFFSVGVLIGISVAVSLGITICSCGCLLICIKRGNVPIFTLIQHILPAYGPATNNDPEAARSTRETCTNLWQRFCRCFKSNKHGKDRPVEEYRMEEMSPMSPEQMEPSALGTPPQPAPDTDTYLCDVPPTAPDVPPTAPSKGYLKRYEQDYEVGEASGVSAKTLVKNYGKRGKVTDKDVDKVLCEGYNSDYEDDEHADTPGYHLRSLSKNESGSEGKLDKKC